MNLEPYRRHRRILTASLVGTAVEFYDFYIYGTAAALVFGPADIKNCQLHIQFHIYPYPLAAGFPGGIEFHKLVT